ncbi:MAG: potassium-transporting ATPase subunit KdpC [Ignavibacteriales bacterium]|nr:potassium-transporting ATPase subunit KdpC [Ignavibacteriales bacterium]
MFIKNLRISLIAIVLFTLLTGLLYPLLVTGIAQLFFPEKANGSILIKNGKILGSALIGQPFHDPKYFWSRPSSTGPFPYNAGASSGSNYGSLNPAFLDGARKRVQDLKAADSLNTQPVPIDLVTASGSGLDPHMSVASALYQLERVAKKRNVQVAQIRSLIDQYTEERTLGFLGEPRVNILKLNLALDAMQLSTRGK